MKRLIFFLPFLLPTSAYAYAINAANTVSLFPCTVKAQNCVKIHVAGQTNISNIWLNQVSGGSISAQYGATYPAQWGVDSPQDAEITTADDMPSSGNEIWAYVNNYASRTGFSVDDTGESFYLINGCPNETNVDECGGDSIASTTEATTTAVTYHDWMLVQAVYIWLLGIIAGGFYFQLFQKKPKWISR